LCVSLRIIYLVRFCPPFPPQAPLPFPLRITPHHYLFLNGPPFLCRGPCLPFFWDLFGGVFLPCRTQTAPPPRAPLFFPFPIQIHPPVSPEIDFRCPEPKTYFSSFPTCLHNSISFFVLLSPILRNAGFFFPGIGL